VSVIGRIGQQHAPAAPKLSDTVRALLGQWIDAQQITADQSLPNAIEQAIVFVLDAYQAQTDARLAALEKRQSPIITRS